MSVIYRDHALNKWKNYLLESDYQYLVDYVEKIKRNERNDKMLMLCGDIRTGKTTLINDIFNYLGTELCGEYELSVKIMYGEIIKKLVYFSGVHDVGYKSCKLLINLINYNQSIICDVVELHRVNDKLLEKSRVILMDHIF